MKSSTILTSILVFNTLFFSSCNSKNSHEANNKSSSDKVICSEIERKNVNEEGPILIKTCLHKQYKVVTRGYSDYAGRYSYEYSIYRKNAKKKFQLIKPIELFNNNKNELLEFINTEVKKQYINYSEDPETKDCFEYSEFIPATFDELNIDFSDKSINFHYNFGFGSACMSVDEIVIPLAWNKAKKYLK